MQNKKNKSIYTDLYRENNYNNEPNTTKNNNIGQIIKNKTEESNRGKDNHIKEINIYNPWLDLSSLYEEYLSVPRKKKTRKININQIHNTTEKLHGKDNHIIYINKVNSYRGNIKQVKESYININRNYYNQENDTDNYK